MYPYAALRCTTYRENSHANHTWHPPSHQIASFEGSEEMPVWVRFPSPAPLCPLMAGSEHRRMRHLGFCKKLRGVFPAGAEIGGPAPSPYEYRAFPMLNWNEIAGSQCAQYSRNKHCAKWWFILTPHHRSVSIAYRRSGVAMQRRIRESARFSCELSARPSSRPAALPAVRPTVRVPRDRHRVRG